MQRAISLPWIVFVISIVIVANAIADWKHLYFFYWWLDIPMHLLASSSIAFMAYRIFSASPLYAKHITSRFQSYFLAMSIVLTVGVLWEVYEYFFDSDIRLSSVYIFDTAKDLCMDFLGGTFASLYLLTPRYTITHD